MSIDVDYHGQSSTLSLAAMRSTETGPHNAPRVCRCWTSIWPAQCYSQGLSPKGTLCGPLVVTVLQAAWCGHVCHIPPCHPTRRRAVSWLSSCHTWMMLLRLGVWQWLALVTITIRTSLLIHLVQKVCVLEIGRRLIFPLPLLSRCAIYCSAPFMFLSSAFLYSVLTIQRFSLHDTSTHVDIPIQIAGNSSPCLRGLLPPYHTSIHQDSRRKRKPLSKHPWSLPLVSVFCSFFPLFPLGGTLTSFVRTITPLTLGIKTWNLCGLIRFRAEFILSPWKAKRERGKWRIWAVGSIMNVLFAQIDILKTNVRADHMYIL